MKITIWSDFVCPFCFIGESHLNQALDNLEYKDDVEIEFKSFLLTPDAKYIPGKTYAETFAQLKGTSLEDTNEMLNNTVQMAKESGLEINYDIAKFASSLDAHRVFQYAKENNKGNEFFQKGFNAHLNQGKILSDKDTLINLAENLELDGKIVENILDDKDLYMDMVTDDINTAQSLGVQGVPFFVFNNKYALSGAQPLNIFEQVLKQVKKEA